MRHADTCMQVTALGNPNLLHMLSNTIEEVKRLFARFDLDGNGFLTKDEFCKVWGPPVHLWACLMRV